MKKTIYLAAAALSMLSMAACSGNKCGDGKCANRPDEVYVGTIPMADANGMTLTIALDYDNDKANNAGDYALTEQIIEPDSAAMSGINVQATFLSEGDFKVIEKGGKKYIKLVMDAKDSNPSSSDYTFLVASDSTIKVVNPVTFEETPDSLGLNYTLKLQK